MSLSSQVFERYRFIKGTLQYLHNLIADDLRERTRISQAISPMEQLRLHFDPTALAPTESN